MFTKLLHLSKKEKRKTAKVVFLMFTDKRGYHKDRQKVHKHNCTDDEFWGLGVIIILKHCNLIVT
ncbi:hypothetical protein HJC23_011038 [Cyclotella cryptica]|uniref:LAGLIDADG homing endonuclease n=1 Tax=Cyclotella cryptica TaxID=29204 RepID=A0ABD3PFX6_9STRA